MGARDVENLIYFFIGGLMTYGLLYIRMLWDQRRQPTRRDAPTGREPWVKPQARIGSKEP